MNTLINKLPFELHIPGYQYCGPGTKVAQRVARGDVGVNPLDAACKQHDLAYSQNSSLADRHKADWELENRAWERVKSKDASIGEKAAAWFVTTGMKAKRKLGMGHQASLRKSVLMPVSKVLKKALKNQSLEDRDVLKKSSLLALRAARAAIKKAGGRRQIRIPRIIPIPKSGGFLPLLLPLIGALGGLGGLAGGASAIAKTVIDAKNAKKKLEEEQRHNKAMEEIGKKGSGLYLRKTPRGFGLYLKKQSKNYL